MVRRLLRDDPGYAPAVVEVSEACIDDPLAVFPDLSIFVRRRTGYDGDGDPVFEWDLVAVTKAIAFAEPAEIDSLAGISVSPGRATVLYDGDVPITSTAVAHSSFGSRYRVTSAIQIGEVLELELLTVEDVDDEG